MTNIIDSIHNMIDNPLCTGCGACAGVCPTEALEMKINNAGVYKPLLNEDSCISCGLCTNICPVNSENFKNHFISINRKYNKNNIGELLGIYIGYSTNKETRYNGASGGVVTEILKFLMEKKLVDGVIMPTQSDENPIIYTPEIITDVSKITENKGSMYLPIPMNLFIKEIKNFNGKVGFVGLPCHIWAIERLSKTMPHLYKKIRVKIGLTCGQAPSLYATKYLLKKLNIGEEDIKKIRYRGNGWPGNFIIELMKDQVIKIPYESNLGMGTVFSSIIFTPYYCNFCMDPFSVYADISVSDAWYLKNKGKKYENGVSIIIIRNKKWRWVIKEMESINKIEISNSSEKYVVSSNQSLIHKRLRAVCMNEIINNTIKNNYVGCSGVFKWRARIYLGIINLITKFDFEKLENKFPLWAMEILKITKYL